MELIFTKAYLGANVASTNIISSVDEFDIKVDSAYQDVVIIQGSPLETEPIFLSGKVIFSLSDDVVVKKVPLKLTGTFKLEFIQMGRDRDGGKLASIVKENCTVFECLWDNLLLSPQGTVTVGCASNFNELYNRSTTQEETQNEADVANNESNNSSSIGGLNRLIRKSAFYSSNVLEINVSGSTTTPYECMQEDFNKLSPSTLVNFKLLKGSYELPFRVMLPSEIPETIEGLQSGSILYKFDAFLDRRNKKVQTSSSNSNISQNSASNVEGSGESRGSATTFYNYRCYKYIRIFRTLSIDNLARQEEINVGRTLNGRLQYEVKIPSRGIPIGSITPITIKIFPFQKHYKLEKITVNLLQYYRIKDMNGETYEDEVTIMKQSMSNFDGFIKINEQTGTLIDKVEINSFIKLPSELKKITQNCDMINDHITTRHDILITIHLKTLKDQQQKKLEIKATIPVLLFISPQFTVNGRFVILDKTTGKIHFRSGKFTKLFENSSNSLAQLNSNNINSMTAPYFIDNALNPPPNYKEHHNDRLLQYNYVPINGEQSIPSPSPLASNIESGNEASDLSNHEHSSCSIPTYEQIVGQKDTL